MLRSLTLTFGSLPVRHAYSQNRRVTAPQPSPPVCRVGLLILLALTGLAGCTTTGQVKRYGPPQKRVVRRTYELDPDKFRAAVLDKFRSVHYTSQAPFQSTATVATVPFQSMRAMELKSPNYPPDWLVTWVDPGNFLEPYKLIDGSRRLRDLLIEEPTGELYWQSEYGTPEGPAKFRCGFIIHFEEKSPASTEIQVYEKAPELWLGEERGFAHHGIGIEKFHDIRFVQPTVKDRLDMLEELNRIALNR